MNIQSELTAATKLKPKKGEDEDDFRQRLVEAVSDLDDSKYAKLSKATKSWADSAIEAFNDSGKVPAFDDEDEDEEVDDEAEVDEDEDDEPAKSKKAKSAAKKKKVAAKDDEDVEEEEDEDGDVKEDDEAETEEDDDDMQTQTETGGGRRRTVKTKAKGAASKKAAASNGKAKKKVVATGRKDGAKTGGGQTKLKQILARDPDMSIDELETRLKKQGHEMSRMTLSTQRSGFRHTVKVLQDAGLLKKTLIS